MLTVGSLFAGIGGARHMHINMIECERPVEVVFRPAALTTQPVLEVAMATSHSTCAVCGKQFKSYNPTPTFCSKACKNKSLEAKFDVDAAIRMYQEGATQDEVAERCDVTQKVIWSAFRRRGVKCRKATKRNQWGEKNQKWKGDDASYSALHFRVERLRGTPSLCEVCGTTTAKRFEWANLTGNYADPMDYKRMCCSCHHKHDGTARNFLQGAKGGGAT